MNISSLTRDGVWTAKVDTERGDQEATHKRNKLGAGI